MKHILIALTLLTTTATASAQHFTFGTAANPQGQTILVDKDGFVIDGHHTIPVMGEMHYTRVPREDWRREIRKMKAGGITILSTYVFWIHHEAEEGHWDWSGNHDLHAFLDVCRQEQMPVVLRIGPFCHGEVLQGGIPTWLVERALSDPAQYKLRSLAPGFIQATERLYSNIYAQCNDMLWRDGGPIIGLQIENECRGPWAYYKQLLQTARRIGFDLPFYTRTGWPKLNGAEEFGQLLPLYGDYADGFWDRVLTDMPGEYSQAFVMKRDSRLSSVIATEALGTDQDTRMERQDLQYPYLTCELGGGMMPSYHRRINISGHEIQPLAICKLGSGSNLPGYYMYHGGSNPTYYSPSAPYTSLFAPIYLAENQASPVTNYNDMPLINYDFQAPLGEMGQPNPTAWHESRWLHQFLADWGEELATMPVDSLSPQYARRGCFEFRCDYVRILHPQGSASVTFRNMTYQGHQLSSATLQPFAKADDGLYFITVPGAKNHDVTIDGRRYRLRPDRTLRVGDLNLTLLSTERAKQAYVIDHHLYYAPHNGILYPGDKTAEGPTTIYEESWQPQPELQITATQQREAGPLRTVAMGVQRVAAMPSDQDFASRAAHWSLQLPESFGDAEHSTTNNSPQADNVPSSLDANDYFLNIHYRGDCARLVVDGKLVADHFWNGTPMRVRASQLVGHHDIQLQILPLGRDYPIYLQQEQRAQLDAAPDGILLSLDAIEVVHRSTTPL